MRPRIQEGIGGFHPRRGPRPGRAATAFAAAWILAGCGGNPGARVGGEVPSGGPGEGVHPVEVAPATGEEVLQAVMDSGGRAVLVNVWATFCPPCLEEMPDILRLRRNYRSRGLEVILVSGDFGGELPAVIRFLGAQGVDFPSYIKAGEDMEFIEALHPGWTGALPASFLFDGGGSLRRFWEGRVSYAGLEEELLKILEP